MRLHLYTGNKGLTSCKRGKPFWAWPKAVNPHDALYHLDVPPEAILAEDNFGFAAVDSKDVRIHLYTDRDGLERLRQGKPFLAWAKGSRPKYIKGVEYHIDVPFSSVKDATLDPGQMIITLEGGDSIEGANA